MDTILHNYSSVFNTAVWAALLMSWLWLLAIALQILPLSWTLRKWASASTHLAGKLHDPNEQRASADLETWIFARIADREFARFAVRLAVVYQERILSARDVVAELADGHRHAVRHLGFLRSIGPLLAVGGVAAGVGPFARSLGQAQMDAERFAASFDATALGVGLAVVAHTLLFFMKGWFDSHGRSVGERMLIILAHQQHAAFDLYDTQLTGSTRSVMVEAVQHYPTS